MVGESECQHCGRTFRWLDGFAGAGRHRRYCGDACRQRAHRARSIEQLAIVALDHLRAAPDRAVLSTLAALDRSSLVMLVEGLRGGAEGR